MAQNNNNEGASEPADGNKQRSSYQNQLDEINQLNGHTIMLVQFSSNEETRTYLDCKNPDICFETFLRLYENF